MDSLTTVLVPLVIFALFAWARQRVPPARALTSAERSALDAQFRVRQLPFNLLMFAIIGVIGVVLWWIFRFTNNWLAGRDGNPRIVLLPTSLAWAVLAGFFSASAGWPIFRRILAKFIGDEQAEIFFQWTYAKSGFDSGKVLMWMFWLVGLPALIFAIGALPIRTTFHDGFLRTRSFAQVNAHDTEYAKIQTITTTEGYVDRTGAYHPQPCVLLHFSNGDAWTSCDQFTEPDSAQVDEIAKFLESKTGLSAARRHLTYDLSK